MKVCIVSGRYPATDFDSAINHKVYADRHGYAYAHCNWPTKEQNRYLNKMHYIRMYIDVYDYIIWIDDDAFFFDFEKDIMEYAPSGDAFLSICESPSFKPLKTFFSSGQFILKSSKESKAFLDQVIQQDLNVVKSWWTEDLGYFSKGDQDAMIYLLKTNPEFKNASELYDYTLFNSRPENLFGTDSHAPMILHFTGKVETKMANYNKVQKELNLHSSLVPKLLLEEYNIQYHTAPQKKSIKKKIKDKLRWLKP
ncbi:MAG: hypothetical protein ACI9Y7_002243 [Dokdonia sp.]|jgi:hypothetical protein